MKNDKDQMEANLNQLLETFNADDTELVTFLENPISYLEKLGVTALNDIDDDELRRRIQKHTER